MAITYTTRIENMEHQLADGKVLVVHWSIYGTDGTYGIGTTTAAIQLDGDVTTPYADLTPELVAGWVETALGEEKLKEIHDMIAANIKEQSSPTFGAGLPWAAA